MWLSFSLFASLCTSLTTIFAKIGIKNVNSNFATCFRTLIVIFCSIVVCFLTNGFSSFKDLDLHNWVFLVLSGIATGCSWLCYYKAVSLGNINKIAPIDKSSFILTSALFMIFFFQDTTKNGDVLTIIMIILSNILMLIGTILMIGKKDDTEEKSKKWLIYAILSAVFASLVSLFVKIGLKGISSNLGTLIRTIIVLIFSSLIVIFRKDYQGVNRISKTSWLFLFLSGLATGGAWLFEYYSLNMAGVNPIAVNSIGKLSILLTMLFSFIVLKEKFNKKSIIGLSILTLGIVIIIIFSL